MSVIKVDTNNFNEIISSDKPVIVDFSATWCPPCKALEPIFDETASENIDIIFAKLDIDESSDIASKYFVQSVPTIISFKNGEEFRRVVGAVPKNKILGLI